MKFNLLTSLSVMNYTQVEIGKMFFGEFVQMFAPWNLVDW